MPAAQRQRVWTAMAFGAARGSMAIAPLSAPLRVHVTGAEGEPRPAGARPCSAADPDVVRRVGDRRPTSSSTSAPAITTCAPAGARTSPTAPPRCSHDATVGDAVAPRARVVGDGLRRVRQQPGAADRGRHPAPRRRVRLRPPAGDRRGDGRPLAARRARAHGDRAAAGRRDGRRRHVVAGRRARRRARPALRRGRPAGAVPPPRRPRRRRSCSPSSSASTACSTSRPTAGSPASGCGR